MKDLGPAKKFLGIQINRDRKTKKLYLSQERRIEKILMRFRMDQVKAVSTPLGVLFKLSTTQCPSTDAQKRAMERIHYASTIGSLMYAMICSRPDLAHLVSIVSRYRSNLGKEYWDVVKWILRYL